MPPKSSKKAKEVTPEPPKVKQEPKTPAAPKKSASKKPKPEPAHFENVKQNGNAALAVDVAYEGWNPMSEQKKNGAYSHTVVLTAPHAFSLVGTIMFTEGDLEGHQAIIIRPARPFPFLKLPKELRARIYTFYFASNKTRGVIALDGKRNNKDIFAKTFAENLKNRVALLAVNKEVNVEATPILYTTPLRLESTATLLDFLSQIPAPVRLRLHTLEIKNFVKTSSRNAMHFLAEARNLQRFHIEAGVCSEGDPVKAAKQFYAEAYKFLEAVGSARGNKAAGVDVLSFGAQALMWKDEKKNAKPWSEALVKEFRENLKAKLK